MVALRGISRRIDALFSAKLDLATSNHQNCTLSICDIVCKSLSPLGKQWVTITELPLVGHVQSEHTEIHDSGPGHESGNTAVYCKRMTKCSPGVTCDTSPATEFTVHDSRAPVTPVHGVTGPTLHASIQPCQLGIKLGLCSALQNKALSMVRDLFLSRKSYVFLFSAEVTRTRGSSWPPVTCDHCSRGVSSRPL